MLKRYLVFVGGDYYPRGGWLDYSESFDSEEEAREEADKQAKRVGQWAHVVDTQLGVVIHYGGEDR